MWEHLLHAIDRADPFYGQPGVSLTERFRVWLSQRAIRGCMPRTGKLRVLELGCGYRATQLMALRDRISQGMGVDFRIDPALRPVPNLSFVEGSVEDLLPHLPAKSFDLVLLISALEHLREPAPALAHTFNLIRPGGALFINVPTWRGKAFLEFAGFRFGHRRLEIDDHKMYYDKRDLWPMLVRAGFRPQRIWLRYHKFGLNLFAVATRGPSSPAKPEA